MLVFLFVCVPSAAVNKERVFEVLSTTSNYSSYSYKYIISFIYFQVYYIAAVLALAEVACAVCSGHMLFYEHIKGQLKYW